MSHSIPSKQKALVLPEAYGQYAVQEIDVIKPGAGEVLVRTEVVGLNPVDHSIQKRNLFSPKYPVIAGWEAAGTVVQLGDGVTSFAVGDKVFYPGTVWSNNTTAREYNVTPADMCAKVPQNLTVDEAASIGLTLDTAALGLYSGPSGERSGAGLTPPWTEGGHGKYAGQPCVIFGGASGVGQYAIQLAKLSGYSPIITTASVKNTEYLKSLGATHVLDRNFSPSSLTTTIAEITQKPVQLIFDAVSSADTQNLGYELLSPGGTLVLVRLLLIPDDKITSEKRVTAVFGSPFLPDRRALSAEMYRQLTGMFERGELKASILRLYGQAGPNMFPSVDQPRRSCPRWSRCYPGSLGEVW
ncbi:hypothetical protein EIP86_003758 [Pleurotus ostreatoroseus]|nr:hypothetical protein EIP86_003758 [Pleurotus ostreatoroseus]